jgi:hypothetical protein
VRFFCLRYFFPHISILIWLISHLLCPKNRQEKASLIRWKKQAMIEIWQCFIQKINNIRNSEIWNCNRKSGRNKVGYLPWFQKISRQRCPWNYLRELVFIFIARQAVHVFLFAWSAFCRSSLKRHCSLLVVRYRKL